MNISLAFTRIFFAALSIFFMTVFMISSPEGATAARVLMGMSLGVLFTFLLIGFDTLFKRFNLRAFNIAVIGIFLGYLMGQALVLVFDAVLEMSSIDIHLSVHYLEICKIALFLFGLYLGTIMTLRAADELYVSIPFVKFAPMAQKKKDMVLDQSVLSDARIIDFCATGIVDYHLIIPRFIIKDLYAQLETGEESMKTKAKQCLDVVKKLEAIASLEMRYNDTDFPDVKDPLSKLIRLARLVDANILTADISRIQMASIEGVRIVNMHALSNALKPLMEAGETIQIKIQRYGKEPRQGVGYLDDGTMVVVNGGGDFIGRTIQAQVLSVKHTSSGRMIFCNTAGEGFFPPSEEESEEESEDE